MKREEVLGRVKEAGVVAVVRGNSKEQGLKIVEAAVKGGIKVMELYCWSRNSLRFRNSKSLYISRSTIYC